MEINGVQFGSSLRRGLVHRNCDKHGQFSVMWFVDKDGNPIGTPLCPKCKEEEDAKEREEMSRLYVQNLIKSSLLEADVPEDNIESRFSNYEATTDYMKEKLEVCKKFSSKNSIYPSCLCFLGKTGTGKTHLSISCLANSVIESIREHRQEDKIKYTRASELMRDFKSIMNTKKGGTTENQLMREYQSYDMLVIDELGRFLQGDYSLNIIQEIIAYRLESNKKTILVLNGTFQDLKQIVGEHIISKQKKKGKSLKFDEEDYRKKDANGEKG